MGRNGIICDRVRRWNLAIISLVFFCVFNISAAARLSIKCSSIPYSSVPAMPVVYCENIPRPLRHRLLVEAPSPGPSHDHKVFTKENNDNTVESPKKEESLKENSAAHMVESAITESKEAVARRHRMKIESAAVGGIIIGGLLSTVLGALVCYVRVTRRPVS